MKHNMKRTLVIIIATFGIGLLIGWLIFGKSSMDHSNHKQESEQSEQSVWTCSMHPQIKQPDPGDCPICGMDLIPLESSSDSNDSLVIKMSPSAMKLAQVQTIKVSSGAYSKSINLTGKVQADERLLFSQSAHIPGRIEKLTVNFTGEYVEKGQVVAYMYSPELMTAQEELLQAQKIRTTQPELFNAAVKKLENWKLSQAQINQILESKRPFQDFPVLANTSGYVTKKLINVGDYLKQGEPIYNIADLSKVWILFDVYESDLQWINKGSSVKYTVQSMPGKEFTGTVSYIDPIINNSTRVAKARIVVANSQLKFKPEMFVSGTIQSKVQVEEETVIVPKTAVMWTGTRSVVYVMESMNSGVGFTLREVKLGPSLGDKYVVEEGLKTGEEIAVNGTFSIDAAAQLEGKPSMMNRQNSEAKLSKIMKQPTLSKGVEQNLNPKTKEDFKKLLTSYLEIKSALVSDDYSSAMQGLEQMQECIRNISYNKLDKDLGSFLNDQKVIIESNLGSLASADDLKHFRKAFKPLSNSMINLVKHMDIADETIYVQYCPMADNNQGAEWLSLEDDIRNPYFGASMLTCGEVSAEY